MKNRLNIIEEEKARIKALHGINEQDEGGYNAKKIADEIVSGYQYGGPIKTEQSQFMNLYGMYTEILSKAKKSGGKIKERDYNDIVNYGITKKGMTAPILPYKALKVLSQYI